MTFDVYPRQEVIDPHLNSLPPCTIERTVTANGVHYPVVLSHWIPNEIHWDSARIYVNEHYISLINLGHGSYYTSPFTYEFLTNVIIAAQKVNDKPTWENSRIVDKSLRPPEVIMGLPYSSKADTWMLGCAVGSSTLVTYLHFKSPFTVVPHANRRAACS